MVVFPWINTAVCLCAGKSGFDSDKIGSMAP